MPHISATFRESGVSETLHIPVNVAEPVPFNRNHAAFSDDDLWGIEDRDRAILNDSTALIIPDPPKWYLVRYVRGGFLAAETVKYNREKVNIIDTAGTMLIDPIRQCLGIDLNTGETKVCLK